MAARDGAFGWLYISPLMLVLVPFFVAPIIGGGRRELPAERRLRRHHRQHFTLQNYIDDFQLRADVSISTARPSSSRF